MFVSVVMFKHHPVCQFVKMFVQITFYTIHSFIIMIHMRKKSFVGCGVVINV